MGGEEEYITEIGPHDVLFGRGSGPNSHDGNVRFRALVNQRKEEYLRTNHRQTKVKIAGEIVQQVLANGGRFLKRVSPADAEKKGIKTGEVWCAVDHETMMEKAKQALRQNLERQQNKEGRNSNMDLRMNAPRVVTPGGSIDPYEPDPVREVLPMMPTQSFQPQPNFSSSPANMEAWAAMNSNNGGFSMSNPQQQVKANSLSELTGSVEISNLIQSIVNVRKDEYFCANDPNTKAMIAREIVDAALAESNRARQGLGGGGPTPNVNPYPSAAEMLQQQQNLHMPSASQSNPSMPPPALRPSSGNNNGHFQSAPPNMGGGGFNLYTMAANRERTTSSSSGGNQFSQNGVTGMQPPQTSSSSTNLDTTTGGGFEVPSHSGGPNKDLEPTDTTDDQSLGDYQMMLEQYLSNTLGDSNSAMMSNPDLGGNMADQDSIGTFNQSETGDLESMAESLSIMSYTSKHKKGGGIDSFLSANAPSNKTSSSSNKRYTSSSSRNSRASNRSGLKAHFSLQDQKRSKSKTATSSVMSGKSHRSSKSKQSSVCKDDISLMSGISNFSGMSNDDHMSLMSEMTDLSEALNSLDLASQVLK